MQPWRCYVLVGEERQRLVDTVDESLAAGKFPVDSPEFAVYPTRETLRSPQNAALRSRRLKLGIDMYAKLGVAKGDDEGSLRALKRNYEFFNAPVGIIVTVDKAMDKNGFGHVGCFLQTLCLLAEERGLATCLQEAWSQMSEDVVAHLEIDTAREAVWCGVALGYADESKPVNSLVTERAPVHEFAKFIVGGASGWESVTKSKL
jgi:nitroreductase